MNNRSVHYHVSLAPIFARNNSRKPNTTSKNTSSSPSPSSSSSSSSFSSSSSSSQHIFSPYLDISKYYKNNKYYDNGSGHSPDHCDSRDIRDNIDDRDNIENIDNCISTPLSKKDAEKSLYYDDDVVMKDAPDDDNEGQTEGVMEGEGSGRYYGVPHHTYYNSSSERDRGDAHKGLLDKDRDYDKGPPLYTQPEVKTDTSSPLSSILSGPSSGLLGYARLHHNHGSTTTTTTSTATTSTTTTFTTTSSLSEHKDNKESKDSRTHNRRASSSNNDNNNNTATRNNIPTDDGNKSNVTSTRIPTTTTTVTDTYGPWMSFSDSDENMLEDSENDLDDNTINYDELFKASTERFSAPQCIGRVGRSHSVLPQISVTNDDQTLSDGQLALMLQMQDLRFSAYAQLLGEQLDLFGDEHEEGLNLDEMTYEELLELEERMGTVSKGATMAQINQCPERRFEGVHSARGKTCPICQDDFEIGNLVRVLPCNHPYHTPCIDTWLTQQAKCPVCQYSLKG